MGGPHHLGPQEELGKFGSVSNMTMKTWIQILSCFLSKTFLDYKDPLWELSDVL